MDGDGGGTAATECDVVVIGAGIAGLAAAGVVAKTGRRVVVLEKSRGVGGRMATRRLGTAVFDHGAQFFTVRARAFGTIVAEAHAAGAVRKWCDGFAQAAANDAAPTAAGDGHPRWCGDRGMTDLPKRLAAGLTAGPCAVSCDAKALSIGIDDGRVRIVVEQCGGRDPSSPTGTAPAVTTVIRAAGAIVTSPVPQSLDLLASGGLLVPDGGPVDAEALRLLATVDYDPCFTLMLVLDRPSRVPPPGGIQFASGPIAWLADNLQKGISSVPALTLHASAAFSREHFDAPQDRVAGMLLDLARPWIDGPAETAVIDRSLHRWKFSQPTVVLPTPLVAATHAPPIVCCGDAFGGPRVEGAASSGLAAGRWMVRVLETPAGR